MNRFLRAVVLGLLHLYRYGVSPARNALLGTSGCCRFSPTCSAYAVEAVRRHGVVDGAGLTLRRLCRCHPWGGAGTDPVPPLIPSTHA